MLRYAQHDMALGGLRISTSLRSPRKEVAPASHSLAALGGSW